jgi:far upstream element-binding protein
VQRENERVPGAPTRIVTIEGAPDAIAMGKSEIERIISERNNKQPQFNAGLASLSGGVGAPGCSVDVMVPNDKVGLVIGRGGSTIKGML